MRLFQTIGLADELLPHVNASRNIRHVNADGQLFLLITRGGIGPEGWNNAYRFYQPELEALLRKRRERVIRSIDVRLRWTPLRSMNAAIMSRIRYENLASGELDERSRALCGRMRRRALDGAPLHGRRPAGSALARALDRARYDPGRAPSRRSRSRRRNRARDRRHPILRPGAADDVRSHARQAPSLGIHADAAG